MNISLDPPEIILIDDSGEEHVLDEDHFYDF
jgi:hypothetical protein